MCVIIFKPQNVSLENKTLALAKSKNPDGIGVCYVEKNSVVIRKGLSLKELKKLLKTHNNKNVLIHFRFATHGAVGPAFCHPFPISDNDKDLKRTHLRTDIALMHNGILTLPIEDALLSDTMLFVKSIAKFKKELMKFDVSLLNLLVATDNKFALMTPSKTVLIGDFYDANGKEINRKIIINPKKILMSQVLKEKLCVFCKTDKAEYSVILKDYICNRCKQINYLY